MATHRIAKIPFSKIIKIGIYNNYSTKMTMNSVYTTLQNKYPGKEVYIQNAGFFGMTNLYPCWGCKSDGQYISNDWAPTCFMAMKGNQIKFFPSKSTFPADYTDGISGYPALIENGKKSSEFHNAPDGKSDRGRSMVGYTSDSLVISCIADVSGSSDFTLAEELQFMLNKGCTYAINLDGGGSAQCNFNGDKITSSRKVSNFLYVIVEKAPAL